MGKGFQVIDLKIDTVTCESSRLLHVIYLGLTCGGNLQSCDVNGIVVRVDVSRRVYVVSFVTLKDLRIVHIPDSLVGDEAQFVAIFLNCAHDGCQPSPRGRLSLSLRLIGSVLGESDDDAQAKAQRENGQ